MSLFSDKGLIAKLSNLMAIFPICWYLTFALELHALEPVMDFLMTFGGLLNKSEPTFPYTHSIVTVFGGIWAFGVAAPSVISLILGDKESKDFRECRQMVCLFNWLGWLIGCGKYIVIDGNLGGIMGSSFNYVWLGTFTFFLYAHWGWFMSSDLGKKLKLA